MSSTRPKLDPHRTKTALRHRRQTLPQVAQAGGVTARHLEYVISGQRPGSQRVYAALRNALGPSGWTFATRQTDTLYDDGPAGEVAPHAA